MNPPRFAPLAADPAWRAVDFISDLHLQASDAATFGAWRDYLAHTSADAVFLLGDLFEVWIGDDAAAQPGFAAECAAVLRTAAQRRPLFFLHGNRDFLVGADWLAGLGVRLLDDPTVLTFGSRQWLLSHGDALCLDDLDYMRFRAEVRTPQWQQAFLARPLADRAQVARSLRERSESRKQSGAPYADLDAAAVTNWLDASGAQAMLHGHTHRPADHPLAHGRMRHVLSDWDLLATPPRCQVLRLDRAGMLQRIPHAAA